MTKLELNDKLEKIYPLSEADMCEDNQIPLIDDSARMFDLMVEHRIGTVPMTNNFLACTHDIESRANYSAYESPQDAARVAIAMALVKLAESKS